MLNSTVFSILLATGLVQASVVANVQRDSAAASTTCTEVLATPKPKGTQCGVHGFLREPAILGEPVPSNGTSTSAAIYSCEADCRANERCISFSVDPTTSNDCTLYSKHLESMELTKRSKTPAIFYNVRCFKNLCSTITPCGDTPGVGGHFLLRAIAPGTPIDGFYATVRHKRELGHGRYVIFLAPKEVEAFPFSFTYACNLETSYDRVEVYEQIGPSFSNQGTSILLDEEASYEHIYREFGERGFDCHLENGELTCTSVAYGNTAIFSYCSQNNYLGVLEADHAVSVSNFADMCYSFSFETIRIPDRGSPSGR